MKIGGNEYTPGFGVYGGIIADSNGSRVYQDDKVSALNELVSLREENEQYRQRHDWDLCRKLDDELVSLRAANVALKSLLEDCAYEMGYEQASDGKRWLSTGGLSTVESIFAILGWSDPHEIKEHPDDK